LRSGHPRPGVAARVPAPRKLQERAKAARADGLPLARMLPSDRSSAAQAILHG